MKHRLFLISLIIPFISFNTYGQDDSWKYFGQKSPKGIPEVFAPGIISKKSLEHSSPSISPDGKTIIWCSIKLPYKDHKKKIWITEYINNKWSTPKTIDLFNDNYNIGIDSPVLSVDGERLYISSERVKVKNPSNIPSEWIENSNNDIWYVDRVDNKWEYPVKLTSKVNTNCTEGQISVDKNGNIFCL